MDGNKKIIRFGLGIAVVLLVAACATKKTNYVSLYVETVRPEVDSFVADTSRLAMMKLADTLVVFHTVAGDSMIQKEELVLLEAVSDFLDEVHTRLDSIYYGTNADTLSPENRYPNRFPSDSLQLQRNTVLLMNNKVVSQEQSPYKKEKATVEKRIPATELNQLDSEKRVDLTPQLTTTKDTVQVIKRQVEVQRPQTKTEPINVERVLPATTISTREKENTTAMQQQLDAKDGTIQALERQLQTPPQSTVKTERVYVDKMVPVVVSNTTRTETSAPAKQEPTKIKKETVVVDQAVPVVVPVVAKSEPNAAMKQELQVKKDSIQQLKRLLQTKQVTKTDTVYKVKESVQKAVATVDTTTITAFYKIGQRTPNAGFLDSLYTALEGKSIRKVEISGFTDSSGNAAINKRLTDARINYIYSKLNPYVAVHKVFIQNFGKTFASEAIIVEERRVEVKIFRER